MNILDVMKIPAFENANLIAGKAGGEREVQHVNMMDAPDIVDFCIRMNCSSPPPIT